MNISEFVNTCKFDSNGLITAILQDFNTKEILMCAFMNKEALEKTLTDKKCWYYSRSREKLWLKGESSGHVQHVKKSSYDCDRDAFVFQIEQKGGACHKGYRSCFFTDLEENGNETINQELVFNPKDVYKK